MRTNPRVCVEVDDIVDRFNWTTVVVRGKYEELTKAPHWWSHVLRPLQAQTTRR